MEAEIQLGCEAKIVFGSRDRYIRKLRDVLDVKVVARDETILLSGSREAVERARMISDFANFGDTIFNSCQTGYRSVILAHGQNSTCNCSWIAASCNPAW